MKIELPPGKAAIIQWMNDISDGLRYPEHLGSFVDLIEVGEYVVGLETFIDSGMFREEIGWSNAEIDHYARQLAEACELANRDPHPEYLSEGTIDEFVNVFKQAAGYKFTH